MIFDVNDSLNFILDDSNEKLRRAVRLFQFEVALHFGEYCSPESLKTSNGSSHTGDGQFHLKVRSKIMTSARLLATIKMMEYVERNEVADSPDTKLRLESLASLSEFRSLFNNELIEGGGWLRIRQMRSARELDDLIEEAIRKAQSVSQLVDFSLRFEPDPKRKKLLGGITTALGVVPDHEACFGIHNFPSMPGESMLKEFWKDMKDVSAFMHVLYIQCFEFTPPKLVRTKFAETLLRQLAATDEFLQFLANYNELCRMVGDRLKHLRPIHVKRALPAPHIVYDALPAEVLDAL